MQRIKAVSHGCSEAPSETSLLDHNPCCESEESERKEMEGLLSKRLGLDQTPSSICFAGRKPKVIMRELRGANLGITQTIRLLPMDNKH